MLLTMRGETLRYRGQLDQALKDFDEALQISPDGAVVFTARAQTFEKMGNLARARADFQKALSLPSAKDLATTKPAQETARARLAALDAKVSEEKQKELAERAQQNTAAQSDKALRAEIEAERTKLVASAAEAERKRVASRSRSQCRSQTIGGSRSGKSKTSQPSRLAQSRSRKLAASGG